jgi:hypothetical protein
MGLLSWVDVERVQRCERAAGAAAKRRQSPARGFARLDLQAHQAHPAERKPTIARE